MGVRTRESLGLGVRSRTESIRTLRATRRVHLPLVDEEPIDVDEGRPITRGDCANVPRPCPYVGCKYNLFLDVNDELGSIKYNFPNIEPDGMRAEASCTLDIADQGGATLEELGGLSNVTRERIRQLETSAILRLRKRGKRLREFCDAPPDDPGPPGAGAVGKLSSAQPQITPVEVEAESEEPPTKISFFAEGERADDHVCRDVWRIYLRDSVEHGFEKDTSSRGVLAPELAAITPKEEVTMSKEDDLTEREQALLDAYRAHEKKHGTPPSRIVLGRAAGLEAKNDASMQTAVYQATRRLVQRGLIPKGKAGGVTGSTPATKPKPATRVRVQKTNGHAKTNGTNGTNATSGHSRPPPTLSDPLLSSLIAKRDAFAEKVSALTIAITALEES